MGARARSFSADGGANNLMRNIMREHARADGDSWPFNGIGHYLVSWKLVTVPATSSSSVNQPARLDSLCPENFSSRIPLLIPPRFLCPLPLTTGVHQCYNPRLPLPSTLLRLSLSLPSNHFPPYYARDPKSSIIIDMKNYFKLPLTIFLTFLSCNFI